VLLEGDSSLEETEAAEVVFRVLGEAHDKGHFVLGIADGHKALEGVAQGALVVVKLGNPRLQMLAELLVARCARTFRGAELSTVGWVFIAWADGRAPSAVKSPLC